MTSFPRWHRGIYHRGGEAEIFAEKFFAEKHRRVLVLAGAGFDPRAVRFSQCLGADARARCQLVLIREHRPQPPRSLLERAERNIAEIRGLYQASTQIDQNVLANDGAVVGGRQVIQKLASLVEGDFTDFVLDMSAMSVGIGFPIAKLLLDMTANRPSVNVHVLAVDAIATDTAIRPIYSDRATPIHGFQNGFRLDSTSRAARLWLPQLAESKTVAMRLIHQLVTPDEVCPILPFPATDPRLPDRLVEHFSSELTSEWQVDLRNLIYAAERNPVDLYRAILRIADARRRVFEAVGGSMVVISPLGSKAISVGALMAAIERDFPLVYVETVSYTVNDAELDKAAATDSELVHVWLAGEAYAKRAEPFSVPKVAQEAQA